LGFIPGVLKGIDFSGESANVKIGAGIGITF
jgi:hypothetical protein